MQKTLLLLTKSARYGANCVVCVDLQENKYIRLVSDIKEVSYSIPDGLMKYSNGKSANPLDIVEVDVLTPDLKEIQVENWQINKDVIWKYIGTVSKEKLIEYMLDCDDFIFGNTDEFIYYEIAKSLKKSIIFTFVKDLCISYNEYKKSKASFIYKGQEYKNISVTDPDYFRVTCNIHKAAVVFTIPDSSDKWVQENDKYYKFIAKIFPII